MSQKFFGFYWTLPVPWVGFTSLPSDIDAAADASKTIRYCRETVRAYVRSVGGELVPDGEVACIELAPDRGSRQVAGEFSKLLARAVEVGATVLTVDFSGHMRWRGHFHLRSHFDHPSCHVIQVEPEMVHVAGMNPFEHFEEWRARTRSKIHAKEEHRDKVRSALDEMDVLKLPKQAELLNELALFTHNGKPWTADNLRKFLKNDLTQN